MNYKSVKVLLILVLTLGAFLIAGFRVGVHADDFYVYSGTITDSSGDPLADAQVGLNTDFNNGGSGASGTTDASGHFSITTLSNTYYVGISSGLPGGSGSFYVHLHDPINLTAGNVSQDLQLPNVDAATLTVHTKDAASNPIPNKLVSYGEYDANHNSNGIPGSYDLNLGGSLSTDSDGQASLPLFIGSGIDGHASTDYFGTGVSQTLPGTINGDVSIDLTEPQTHTYSGIITDSSGNPVSNVQVSAGYQGSTTNSDGYFSVALIPGTYHVSISGRGPNDSSFQINLNDAVDLTSSDIVQNLQLPNLSAGTLIVHTKDSSDSPIPNQYVSYAEGDDNHTSSGIPGSYLLSLAAGGNSDNDGQITLPLFFGTGIYGQVNTDYSGKGVSANLPSTINDNVSINLVKPPTHTYSGTITDSSGNPAAGVQIGIGTASGTSDAGGHFSLTNFVGTYNVGITGELVGGVGQYNIALNNQIDLTSDVTQNLQLPNVNAATLTVHTKDSSGNPIPNKTVSYNVGDYDRNSSGMPGNYSLSIGGSTTTDNEGHATLPLFLTDNSSGWVATDYLGNSVLEDLPVTIDGDLSIDLIGPSAPTAPSGLSAATPTNIPPVLTWNSVTGANSYNIYRNGVLVGSSTTTSFTDSSLTVGGTYHYTVSAVGSNGIEGSQSAPFNVTYNLVAAPAITSLDSSTATYGSPYSFTVTTSGYPVPTLSKTGALPTGVSFTNNHDGTATIAGTASGSSAGIYTLTIKAHSSAGTVTQTFTLTLNRSPSLKNINNKTTAVGTAFSLPISATAYPAAAINKSGSLPNGLSFIDNGDGTATITGTPSVNSGGSYPITITATNEFGTDTKTFTLQVNETPSITSAASASATIGVPFSFPVTSSGFPAPTVTKTGALPAGITFNGATDTFSGTPHAGTAGSYPITITAHNSSGTVTQNFILVVH